MKKFLSVAAAVCMMAAFAAAAGAAMTEKGTADQSMYMCSCGPDCKCDKMSDAPGKCGCGVEMGGMHLLKVEGKTGVFCACAADCKCEISATDPNMCGCGKPVKKADITGMYICNCGPDCKCNSISTGPGNCNCGKPMMKVE